MRVKADEMRQAWSLFVEDGALPPQVEEKLLADLKARQELRGDLLEDHRMHGMLKGIFESRRDAMDWTKRLADVLAIEKTAEAFAEDARRRFVLETRRDRRRGARIAFLAAAAGAAAIAAGWLMVGEKGQGASGKGQGVARVEAASGQWTVDSGQYGKKTVLKVGDEIRAGDRVVTGEGGRVRLAYVGAPALPGGFAEAGAKVELGANSILSMRPMSPKGPICPISKLEKGNLTAHVEKRSALGGLGSVASAKEAPSSAFDVLTPHAKVTVLGTRFTLRVEGSEKSQIANLPAGATLQALQAGQKSQIPSTWLRVESGLVRFTRLADEKAIEVAAGEFAVAGASASGGYALKAYSNGTEYVDGPIIFEDDFEEELGNWRVVVTKPLGADDDRRHGLRFVPVKDEVFVKQGREAQALSGLRHIMYADRNGKPTKCAFLDGTQTGADIWKGMELRRPLPDEAFVIEYQFSIVSGSRFTAYGSGLNIDLWDGEAMLCQNPKHPGWLPKTSEWCRMRKEYLPLSEAGKKGYELTVYVNGELMTHDRLLCVATSIVLGIAEGSACFDNVVVRKRIRTEMPSKIQGGQK